MTTTQAVPDILDAALDYHGRGWALTPVKYRGKNPLRTAWQAEPFPARDQILEWFDPQRRVNIGGRLGRISGDLDDIDVDEPALVPFVEALLSDRVGKTPRWERGGRRHYLLRVEPLPPYQIFKLGKQTLLELRGDGHQSVLPPSTHPSGELYRWLDDVTDPAQVDADDLANLVQDAVTAYLLAQHWSSPDRHQMALAAAGMLAQRDVDQDRARDIIGLAAQQAGDNEADDRLRAVDATYAREAAGGTITGLKTLRDLLSPDAAKLVAKLWGTRNASPTAASSDPYVARGGRLYAVVVKNGCDIEIPLTTFNSRITEQEVLDDGSDQVSRVFRIVGEHHSGTLYPDIRVPAADFDPMRWPTRLWGATASIAAGAAARDRAREAVQVLSGEPPERRFFLHSGWRRIQGRRVYLHAGGAIGAANELAVAFEPTMARYMLPEPPLDAAASVRRSLALLDLGDDVVSSVLLCSCYLAVLAEFLQPDFVDWLWGRTGSLKSTIAALFLCHFGGFERKTLPADWSSTENFLERQAFLAKDLLLVIDEFAPAKNRFEAEKQASKAERLIRAQGNRSGRGRMRADTSLRPAMPPRGLILSTAEIPPPVSESARARTLALELQGALIDRGRLAEAQQHAPELALAMAAFIAWVAEHYDELARQLPVAFETCRRQHQAGGHLRTPEILAHLEVAGTTACAAFVELGAITQAEAEQVVARLKRDLDAVGTRQALQVDNKRPGLVFVETLREMFAGGRIFVKSRHGGPPPDAESLGWDNDVTITFQGQNVVTPSATRGAKFVGWADDTHLYLQPSAVFAAVTSYLSQSDGSLGATRESLLRDLAELKLIETKQDAGGERRTLPRECEGRQQRVLQMRRDVLELKETP